MLGDDAHARVNSRLVFHTCAHDGSLGLEKGHCLTLHIRTHEGTVRIVVLKERDHRGSDGNDHLRRYVHVVYSFALAFKYLIAVARIYDRAGELSVLGKRLVRLCNGIIVLHIRGHIYDLGGDNAGLLVNSSVGSLDEAVLIDLAKDAR